MIAAGRYGYKVDGVHTMRTSKIFGSHRLAMLVIGLTFVLTGPPAALSQTFSNGDVFVAIGSGSVQWRRPNGSLVRTLVAPIAGNTFTTGMAFDSAGDLYVTMFDSQTVAVFDNAGDFLQTFGSGYNSSPESIVIDASNNVYVGQADGSHQILKFDSAGTPLQQFTIDTDTRGSDWIDLGSDFCTMYYTSEGANLKRFNVCTGQQLSDFNVGALPGAAAFAHRLLANGETLVADSAQIVRLDNTGAIVKTYTVTNESNFFALNLDPDGTSFWSADLTSGDVFKFNISTGNILLQFNAGSGTGTVGGITVKGELTASSKPPSTICATRNSRFWFTHAFSSDPTCATLQRALQSNLGGINLGFMQLPNAFENGDGVKDVNDALIEALGFFWRGSGKGSKLCKERKRLAIELIAATANVRLLGTDPGDCTYINGVTTTNFPANLLQQARVAAAGDDIVAVRSMTALLKEFNSSGLTNDFPAGLVDCSAQKSKDLKKLSRDSTTQSTCGGGIDSCDGAEAVIFPNSSDPFASAVFTRSVNLSKFTNSVQSATCGTGGRDATWQVKPTVGTNGRQLTVATAGSNFDTMISVWSGTCSNLTQVSCVNNVIGIGGENLSFTTDGTNTFRIVVEGASGNYGMLKVKITSP